MKTAHDSHYGIGGRYRWRAIGKAPLDVDRGKYKHANQQIRFWRFVDKRGDDECWLWTGRINAYGYGEFAYRSKRSMGAHRYSYALLIGPIPDGLQIDHLCRVRNCVNPRHLEPVTAAENQRRGIGVAVARAKKAMRTHCIRGHSIIGYPMNSAGVVRCRECQRIHDRARSPRKRESA